MAAWPARPIRRAHGGGVGDDVEAGDAGAAGGGQGERGEDADGGRLAGAVVAEQPEDGAGRDVEVEVAQRPQVAVALAEAVGLTIPGIVRMS